MINTHTETLPQQNQELDNGMLEHPTPPPRTKILKIKYYLISSTLWDLASTTHPLGNEKVLEYRYPPTEILDIRFLRFNAHIETLTNQTKNLVMKC